MKRSLCFLLFLCLCVLCVLCGEAFTQAIRGIVASGTVNAVWAAPANCDATAIFEYHGGTDGATVTQSTLAAGAHSTNAVAAYWTLGSPEYTAFAASFYHPFFAWENCGFYNGNGSYPSPQLGLIWTAQNAIPANNQGTGIEINWTAQAADTEIGLWFKTNLSCSSCTTANDPGPAIHTNGTDYSSLNLHTTNGTLWIGVETSTSDTAQAQGIAIQPNTLYWVRVRYNYNPTGTSEHTLHVYSVSGTTLTELANSPITQAGAANNSSEPNVIYLGGDGAWAAAQGTTVSFGDIKLSTSGGSLLP